MAWNSSSLLRGFDRHATAWRPNYITSSCTIPGPSNVLCCIALGPNPKQKMNTHYNYSIVCTWDTDGYKMIQVSE